MLSVQEKKDISQGKWAVMCSFGVCMCLLIILIHLFSVAILTFTTALFFAISLMAGQRVQFKVGPPANDKASSGKGKKGAGDQLSIIMPKPTVK
jgi:hypothetical protein